MSDSQPPVPDEPTERPPAPKINPYAPSILTEPAREEVVSEAVRIRRQHINHETSVGAVGGCFCVVAVPLILFIFFTVLAVISRGTGNFVESIISLSITAIVAAVLLATGLGLRRRSLAARVSTILLSALFLLVFPVGTIVGGYVLYLLGSKKGQTVFSAEYQEIVDETPEVKCQTTMLNIALMIGFIIFVFIGFVLFGVVL